jgi:predicted SAM-dependent methyltransferase
MRRLNFGCGSIQPDGWTNLDREDFGQDYIGTTVDFAGETFDVIAAHCSLQINTHGQIPDLLAELHRILKPCGRLRISLPDIEEGFRRYAAQDELWFPNGETNLDLRFSNWLTWYSTTRVLLTPNVLIRLLLDAGFREADRRDFKCGTDGSADLDDRQHECYFVEAVK